jgi:nucleoside-diphosphate-sugar epimerase
MKIVVTGALGHIGSFLIRDLAFQFPGAEIVMIDNMMTQRFPSLFNLPSLGNYRFIQADITQVDLEPILEGAYALIHLAAVTDAAGSFNKAEILEFNNYQSTVKVANACIKCGVRMISLSSTSVYGTNESLVSEDCNLDELKPQSPYAATKLKEEQFVAKLHREKGLRVVTCRFGTIFGASPGMRFHTAVNKFCWQAVMGEPITVWSTAYNQNRPYLDLNDAVKALAFIIRKDLFNGSIYNVLTQNATVRQVIETIREFVPTLELSFVDSKIMNQLSYEVSCKKFKGEGFSFSGSLQQGIGDTINLIRNANN